jgi:hypothetical protein
VLPIDGARPPIRRAFLGNPFGIDVVTQEDDDAALRRDRGMRRQRVERYPDVARIGLARVSDEKERRLDVLGFRLVEIEGRAATTSGRRRKQ